MSRRLYRVPLHFAWPLRRAWKGFINEASQRCRKCHACRETGLAPVAKRLYDLWYGYLPFRPEDRGSTPYTPDHPVVLAIAQRNVIRSPEFYGTDPRAVEREATRLCSHYNARWNCHLNDLDVAALIAEGRLKDLTHHWSQEAGWQPVVPAVVLTAQAVNDWNISSMGHDAINAFACVEAETKRLGAVYTCPRCEGHGHVWLSEEDKAAYEAWTKTPPPIGEGYQMWETVSEGSPISPVFATALELAQWLSENRAGTVDEGATVEQWMGMIEGDDWAPSGIGTATGVMSGVKTISA